MLIMNSKEKGKYFAVYHLSSCKYNKVWTFPLEWYPVHAIYSIWFVCIASSRKVSWNEVIAIIFLVSSSVNIA